MVQVGVCVVAVAFYMIHCAIIAMVYWVSRWTTRSASLQQGVYPTMRRGGSWARAAQRSAGLRACSAPWSLSLQKALRAAVRQAPLVHLTLPAVRIMLPVL